MQWTASSFCRIVQGKVQKHEYWLSKGGTKKGYLEGKKNYLAFPFSKDVKNQNV